MEASTWPGTHRRVWDFSRDGVLRSLEESLQRLGLDAVDIVYLHDPDGIDGRSSTPPTRHSRSCAGRVSSGDRRRHDQSEMLASCPPHTDMDVLMLAGRYTLLEQSALDDLLPFCEQRGIGIVAAGVFNSGLLARRTPGRQAKYDHAATMPPRRW